MCKQCPLSVGNDTPNLLFLLLRQPLLPVVLVTPGAKLCTSTLQDTSANCNAAKLVNVKVKLYANSFDDRLQASAAATADAWLS